MMPKLEKGKRRHSNIIGGPERWIGMSEPVVGPRGQDPPCSVHVCIEIPKTTNLENDATILFISLALALSVGVRQVFLLLLPIPSRKRQSDAPFPLQCSLALPSSTWLSDAT